MLKVIIGYESLNPRETFEVPEYYLKETLVNPDLDDSDIDPVIVERAKAHVSERGETIPIKVKYWWSFAPL